MRRFMTVLAVLLGFAAPAQAQEQEVLPPTFFDVNGGSVTTPALEGGRTYRLSVGGTFQDVGPNITFDHDAAYCYGDNATMPICRGDESLSQTGLWARYEGSSAGPFYDLSPAGAPAYSSTHRYDVTFVAGQSKPLTFLANTPELDHDYVGQLGVALYAQPANGGCGVRAAGHADAAQCTTFVTPASYKPDPGELVSYRPPPNGKAKQVQGPKVPKDATKVAIETGSTTEQELLAITGSNARDAITLCFFLGAQRGFGETPGLTNFQATARCLQAVLRVLTRCEELRKQRGGPGVCGSPPQGTARASATECVSGTIRLRGRARVKATCAVTPTGTKLTLKARRRGALRKALGKRAKLDIGSPFAGHPVTKGDRVDVTWRVKRR